MIETLPDARNIALRRNSGKGSPGETYPTVQFRVKYRDAENIPVKARPVKPTQCKTYTLEGGPITYALDCGPITYALEGGPRTYAHEGGLFLRHGDVEELIS